MKDFNASQSIHPKLLNDEIMKTFKKVHKDILSNPYESSEVFWTE